MPLLDLCISLDKEFENLRFGLRQLESFSVAVRYPGATVSTQMAEQALVFATQARKFIRTKLSLE